MTRAPRITPVLILLSALAASPAAFAQSEPAAPAAAQPSPPPAAPESSAIQDQPEVVLHLKDGRVFSGILVNQTIQEVVVRIAGIPTNFSTDQIDRVETLEPVMLRYRQLRESVGDNPEQIVRLAEWLQSRERYELALAEVQRALKLDSTLGEALRLRKMLEQQILLKVRGQGASPRKPDTAPGKGEKPTAATRAPQTDFPLLSQDQVNVMKVYEIDLADNPRVVIPRQTITKMLDRYANHPLIPITREGREAIYRMTPTEVLDLMFRLQARDLYPDVNVLDNPRPFTLFRDQVERTWLLNSCATNQCHGGAEAGRLALYNRKPNAERAVYTNFLIVSRYHLADGTPLIDWETPERSPLLQMGLQRDKSRFPHPVVTRGVSNHDAFKPVFRSQEDFTFINAVDWLKSLYRPRPTYTFEYTPLKPFVKPRPEANPAPSPAPAVPTAPAPAPATSTPDPLAPVPASQPASPGNPGAATPPTPEPAKR